LNSAQGVLRWQSANFISNWCFSCSGEWLGVREGSAGYAVFAKVIGGWDVVLEIMKQPATKGSSTMLVTPVPFVKTELVMRPKVD